MEDEWLYANAQDLADHLRELRHRRETLKADAAGSEKKPSALSADRQRIVLSKTGERCHVCGGLIKGPWQADHVLAHSAGGQDSVDNFLPAHDLCNHYRWDYLPEEFQEIVRWASGSGPRSRKARRLVGRLRNPISRIRNNVLGAGRDDKAAKLRKMRMSGTQSSL